MLHKLLSISGLLCLLLSAPAQAWQFRVITETESYTDYELVNDDLQLLSPYSLIVPVKDGSTQFQVLEQSAVTLRREVPAERRMVLALENTEAPLIQVSQPGNFRGRRVSSISINIARASDNEVIILRNMLLRVYKNGDAAAPAQQAKIAVSSPFAAGTWYEIPVSENSIYELDSQYLTDLGINTAAIDPRRIQIWATDGLPLPEANSEPESELIQLPIIVTGESDGVFDAGDRVLFYGNSPHQVIKNGDNYSHKIHPYTDTRYVFLTIGDDNGLRMSPVNTGLNPSATITTFTDFIWKDEQLHKPEDSFKSGRYWLGQRFEATSNGQKFTIFQDTIPGAIQNQQIRINGVMAARSLNPSRFTLEVNGASTFDVSIASISNYLSSEGNAARTRTFAQSPTVSIDGGVLKIDATYRHNETNSTGFVDWLNIRLTRTLTPKNGRLLFYSPADGSASEIVQYRLTGFTQQPIVMDVTDAQNPKLLTVTASGSDFNVNYYSGTNLHIIAQQLFKKPAAGQRIEPSNLKGITAYPDYIIVTSPAFLPYAEELAAYRQNEDGLNPVIALQEQIFNEFSGGTPDPTAIRNYVRHLYRRALAAGETPPKYLLLFGDTTFDYKNIQQDALTNYVFTYQSIESINRFNTFATDDYFGYLDDHEGDFSSGETPSNHFTDIGVGRIPAQTLTEAAISVQKIKTYENPENAGDWQNLFTFAADDDFPNVESNRDIHTLNADETANRLDITEPGIRVKKIYELAYPEEISSAGRRIPGATDDFINSFNSGTLVMNYSGHGNEQVLSDENLFNSDYIPMLTNKNKLSVLVTATCQFGRYDDAAAQSGAEKLVFAENGGAIVAFTTTRVVVTSSGISGGNNFGLNIALSQQMVKRNTDGTPLRFGDMHMGTKNALIANSLVGAFRNSKKFILIGDPAAKFQLPVENMKINSIQVDGQDMDPNQELTIRALDTVNLTGEIATLQGEGINDFTGEATIMVFDAPRSVSLPTNRVWVTDGRCYMNGRSGIEDCHYEVENDVLFRGKTNVINGTFSISFIIPKDISFSENTGRIVFYAHGSGQTASGSFDMVKFSGINPNAENDGKGPEIDVYLNDTRFVNGNLVNNSPLLIAELKDQSGINTSRTGVGHEIIATIDTQPIQTIILNDFYESDINNHTQGRIEYPLDNLPEGSYTLKVRAWDVHNNPSEQEIFFEVAAGDELSVRQVYNYPNPMNNITRFTFEHNQPGNLLNVSIRIYTLSGRPVQHLQEQLITTSSYASISWDGRDRDYDRLGNGTYIYVLRVTADTPKGRQTTEKIEKLVIIR